MFNIATVGADWIADTVDEMADDVTHVRPSDYNEENRYLPKSVTSIPGYLRYAVNPFMREIVDCFDMRSDVRELALMKGVQVTYSTVLESGVLYYAGHVKTSPMMYMTADLELARARIENSYLPMFNQSHMGDIIRSSDVNNPRKTGHTQNHLQFAGGAYLIPYGARNADKMRQFSIQVMLQDEVDAWPLVVGKDGDPLLLSDDRCSGYWLTRKIFRGSTPLELATSKIKWAYDRGDQRKYMVLCKSCNFPQHLRWNTVDKETGVIGGFLWEMDGRTLDIESVRYACQACGHEHYEHDKRTLFSESHGAHWLPTAKPVEFGIRSYHLPALYSPVGMQPWYKCVGAYLKGYDTVKKQVSDIGKYQVFYNNILAEPFEVKGMKIDLTHVSMHRVASYAMGHIPNKFAEEWSGSKILFLTCQVDVHESNIRVVVMGWTRDQRSYIIDYWRFDVEGDDADCTEPESPVYVKLRGVIEDSLYTADDGVKYKILMTFVDSGYSNDTICKFCSDYSSGVHPILGRARASSNQTIREFGEFTTQVGTIGYKIVVDHYKDRLAPVLRREWHTGGETQGAYHFNAPVDMSQEHLKELTVETRSKQTDSRGVVSYPWHRPHGSDNTLWDLLIYGHCAVEVIAWRICIQHFELDTINWDQFWDFAESDENAELFGREVVNG